MAVPAPASARNDAAATTANFSVPGPRLERAPGARGVKPLTGETPAVPGLLHPLASRQQPVVQRRAAQPHKLSLFPASQPGSYPGCSSRFRFCCPHNTHDVVGRLPLSTGFPATRAFRQRPPGWPCSRFYHGGVALAEDIAVALAAWPCPVDSVRPLGGGWNSRTWLVVTPGGRRFVAKLADHLGAGALAAGLRVAEFAAVRGLTCGDPLRTRDGELTVALPVGVLALLRYVPGIPAGSVCVRSGPARGPSVARAHQILRDYPAGEEPRYWWPWSGTGQVPGHRRHARGGQRGSAPCLATGRAIGRGPPAVDLTDPCRPRPGGIPAQQRRRRPGRADRLGNHAARPAAV